MSFYYKIRHKYFSKNNGLSYFKILNPTMTNSCINYPNKFKIKKTKFL